MTANLLVGLAGGGVMGTVIAAIITGIFGRGKSKAEAAKIITDAAGTLTGAFEKQWKEVHAELEQLKSSNRELKSSVDRLTDRVEEALPLLEAEHPHAAEALREANDLVKRAI